MGNSISVDDYVSALPVALLLALECTSASPIGRSLTFLKQLWKQENKLTCNDNVDKGIDDYNALHAGTVEDRNAEYKKLVNSYYDLATQFYEWGWGQSFHFSHQNKWESFSEGTRRHEYYLASMLGALKPGSKVVDVGCGIGGPARNIAKFFEKQVQVKGLTLNPYQVARGNEVCAQQGLAETVELVQCDFMHSPFEDETFDGAYAIEATCHAPDRVGVYKEVLRTLKPGATFACYEWCMTDKFDPTDKEHLKIKKNIEEGDGLPDIISTHACLKALEKAGFEIVFDRDLADTPGNNWFVPLTPSWNPLTQRFQFNWLGMFLTTNILRVLEVIYLVPKGTSKTQQMLQKGGVGCARGGQTGIFTPMYLMVGRKPLETSTEKGQ